MAKKIPKKTTSFRIEPATIERLQKISREDEISMNILVNQILSSYLD